MIELTAANFFSKQKVGKLDTMYILTKDFC